MPNQFFQPILGNHSGFTHLSYVLHDQVIKSASSIKQLKLLPHTTKLNKKVFCENRRKITMTSQMGFIQTCFPQSFATMSAVVQFQFTLLTANV